MPARAGLLADDPGRRGVANGCNPVLLVLLALAAAAALAMPLLSVAPNRIVAGTGVPLGAVPSTASWLLLGSAAALGAASLRARSRALQAMAFVSAALALTALVWLAGEGARQQSAHLRATGRVSLGAGFWLLAALAWLAAAEVLRKLRVGTVARLLAMLALLLPPLALLGLGRLDALALLKEYANRHDVFDAACARHVQIVLATLLPALPGGIALGVVAARRTRFAAALFPALNVIQTIPSVALFGLLIAPLALLGSALPGWDIQGVGLLPAVIALFLYSLLPIVQGTVSGLRQVPPDVIDSAIAMGLTPRQRFWRVEAPLALPVLVSALRVTVVQLIGLAVVAALIGAGGLGTLVFQGLLGGTNDLVLLGVLPVVALALAADAALGALAASLAPRRP